MTRDDAVIGEAAGIAMGLVMLGTRSPMALEDMTNVREGERERARERKRGKEGGREGGREGGKVK